MHVGDADVPPPFDVLGDRVSSPDPVAAFEYHVNTFAASYELWSYFFRTKRIHCLSHSSPMHVLHFGQWAAH